MTLPNSQLTMLDGPELSVSTCSQPDSHVRTSALPAEALASTAASQASGIKFGGLSVRLSLYGASLRTRPCSEYAELTSCSKGWKTTVTPAGRSWWVLTTRVRRISESESLFWPTATASASHQGQNNPGGQRGQTLVGAVREQPWSNGRWATPTVNDSKNNASPSQLERRSDALNVQVATWPTVTATNRNESETLEEWEARRQRCKETAQNGNGFGTPLAIAVKQQDWPTLVAQSDSGGPRPMDGGAAARQNLGDAMGADAAKELRAQLNPDWCECLMGYPVGWTSLDRSPGGRRGQEKSNTTTSRRAQ